METHNPMANAERDIKISQVINFTKLNYICLIIITLITIRTYNLLIKRSLFWHLY